MSSSRHLSLPANARLLFDEAQCQTALKRMAEEIDAVLHDAHPLVLSVMGGAVVFSGQLLPLLRFALDFDYIHVSRYGQDLCGHDLRWIRAPQKSVEGRDVLILDDILDEGHTMNAIYEKVLELGAASCRSAVFADKQLTKPKPITADFVGLSVPDCYVFGFGMDVQGAWRNLPAIYCL